MSPKASRSSLKIRSRVRESRKSDPGRSKRYTSRMHRTILVLVCLVSFSPIAEGGARAVFAYRAYLDARSLDQCGGRFALHSAARSESPVEFCAGVPRSRGVGKSC